MSNPVPISPEPSPTTATGQPAEPVPPAVEAAATASRLGTVELVRREANPVLKAILSVVASAALFGLVYLIALAQLGFLRFVAISLFAMSVAWLIGAVIALLRGVRRYYLFTGGIVWVINGRVRAVAWSEVTQVECRTARRGIMEGKLIGYRIRLREGGSRYVAAFQTTEAETEFSRRLAESATRAGVAVVD